MIWLGFIREGACIGVNTDYSIILKLTILLLN